MKFFITIILLSLHLFACGCIDTPSTISITDQFNQTTEIDKSDLQDGDEISITQDSLNSLQSSGADRIDLGKNNYNNIADENMLEGFKAIGEKLKIAYQEVENETARMFEDNARIKYDDAINTTNTNFLLKKSNDLENSEIDSYSIKTKKKINLKGIK